jgi:L-threonylcarbamoyladenylate synthase
MIQGLTKGRMAWYDFKMSTVILYPTETVYGIGVNPLDVQAWRAMCDIKGRSDSKPASWLVKNTDEIYRYAIVPPYAEVLIEENLPGPLTIILRAKNTVPEYAHAKDGTVSFRVSSDPIAQQLITGLDHPLTCTSANVTGLAPQTTPEEILKQLGLEAELISQVYDDGPRSGTPSTVVRCVGSEPEVLREGPIKIDV